MEIDIRRSKMTWFKILDISIRRNGFKQLLFYLSNLDASKFIEISKVYDLIERDEGINLELGCGYSVLPSMLSALRDNYIPLDLSKNACRYQNIKNISPIAADMSRLPFKSSSISNIVALSSIEHVPNDGLVFKEISRVLKDGHLVIFSVPFTVNHTEVRELKHSAFLLRILKNFSLFWRLILGDQHLNYFREQTATDSIIKYYNLETIDREMIKNNLDIEDIYIFEKVLQDRLWLLLPKGWFVLKDFCLGWLFWKMEDRILCASNNGNGIMVKARKRSERA